MGFKVPKVSIWEYYSPFWIICPNPPWKKNNTLVRTGHVTSLLATKESGKAAVAERKASALLLKLSCRSAGREEEEEEWEQEQVSEWKSKRERMGKDTDGDGVDYLPLWDLGTEERRKDYSFLCCQGNRSSYAPGLPLFCGSAELVSIGMGKARAWGTCRGTIPRLVENCAGEKWLNFLSIPHPAPQLGRPQTP